MKSNLLGSVRLKSIPPGPAILRLTFLTPALLSLAMIFLMSNFAIAKGKQPNILFILTDDHCEQALSAYGTEIINTPNMDRIAREGMRFNECYVTNSICGPSRAVIQTGKYSHKNGILRNNESFNGDQQTFPKLLRSAGYQTAIIGKWHLKSIPVGYDHFDVLIGQGRYHDPVLRTRDEQGNITDVKHAGYTTNIITDKTIAWLKEQRNPDRPFLMMCQHKAPHGGWVPEEKYENWLDEVTIPLPETFWDDYSGRTPPASRQEMSVREDLPFLRLNKGGNYAEENRKFKEARPHLTEKEIAAWKFQRYAKEYLRTVRSIDVGIGRILDYLDESGLAGNTIVVYSSDQGWYLGEHGWYDKRWMYEESLHTPLLVRWPGQAKPGTVNNDIVSNVDFAPTFLDMAGIPVPADMQGRSMVPVLKGRTPADWRKYFYYHYYAFPAVHKVARHFGVTDGHYKLIHFYGPSHIEGEEYDEWELFDLENDSNELQSVYDDPDYKETRNQLMGKLDELKDELEVPEDTW